jgi:hypothetical protein
MKMIYRDEDHSYYLDGRRAKSVTAVAKIVQDSWNIDQWNKRMVAVGMLYDYAEDKGKLHEKLAVDPDSRDLGNNVAKQALNLAKAHDKADRGTQMHKALELTLLDRPEKLLTEQQRRDAQVLQRTLDRYGLSSYGGIAEQFVAWPEFSVTGRFDCILTKDGAPVLVDLKSGKNSVLYPHSTAAQLALYARAPFHSAVIEEDGDKIIVEQWRPAPAGLDLDTAYVLLCEPDAEIGELHSIDIAHGWYAVQRALELVNWRKEKEWGKAIATEMPWAQEIPTCENCGGSLEACEGGCWDISDSYAEIVATASNVDAVRRIWREAANRGVLTEDFKAILQARAGDLLAAVGA